ncbi:hypothetical protein CMO96_00445 [Candidatus Woesebacteria bacterium]|nr:hypothetical protein [Candidatus Woesebacteria bacterium]
MTEPELLNRHEKGAWAETWAIAWLLERGFWVARNIAVQGPFDVIAVSKEGKIFIFDVKYVSKPPKDRSDIRTYRVRSDLQKALSIRLFIIDHKKEVTIEPPFEENE